MSALLTAEQAATKLGLDLERFHTLRLRNGWPCVKFGRNDFRFTEEHLAEIIAMQTRGRKQQKPAEARGALAGQTKRSAARGRR